MPKLTGNQLRYILPAIIVASLLGWLGWQLYLWLQPAHEKLLRDDSVQRGLLYCEQQQSPLQLDFYPADPAAGLVLFIHGGGWQQGNRELNPPAAVLVMALRKQGLNVASLDYRLAPEHQLPAMLDDINCALDYLTRRGHELGYNPEKLGLTGFSAGGHLSLLTTGRRKADGHNSVQAVASLFGPTNLTNGSQMWLVQPDNFHDELMQALVGSNETGRLQRASPLFYAEYLDVPSLLVYGDQDQVVGPGQGMDLYWRLRLLGQPSEFLLVKDSGHLTPLSDNTAPDWHELSDYVAAFFSRSLGRK